MPGDKHAKAIQALSGSRLNASNYSARRNHAALVSKYFAGMIPAASSCFNTLGLPLIDVRNSGEVF